MQFIRKYKRYLAVLLSAILIGQLFIFFPFGFDQPKPIYAETDEDRKTAADISNMTGVPIEEILKLRSTVRSWNDVLELLKKRGDKVQAGDRDVRDKRLSETDLDADFLKQLTDEGFSEQDIMEAKMLTDRLQYGIRELTDSPLKAMEVEKPTAVVNPAQTKDDRKTAYQKIAQGFELKTAVRFTLKLRHDFGSLEAALDEYLLSLQLELSLEQYLNNKDQYLKQKEEKRIMLTLDQLVTLAVLEQDLMEKIKSGHSENKEDSFKTIGMENKDSEKEGKQPLPDVPMPNVKDVRPKNPTDEIQRELRQLNPNKH